MRVLLDTHVLLWALADPKKLPKAARARLEDPESDILFSAVSIWEIGVKSQMGRMPASMPPDEIVAAAIASGFRELPMRADAAAAVGALPPHHRDPFDRLLLAQAVAEPARFCTVDAALAAYCDVVRFV